MSNNIRDEGEIVLLLKEMAAVKIKIEKGETEKYKKLLYIINKNDVLYKKKYYIK
jgi:hypothetical protein